MWYSAQEWMKQSFGVKNKQEKEGEQDCTGHGPVQ